MLEDANGGTLEILASEQEKDIAYRWLSVILRLRYVVDAGLRTKSKAFGDMMRHAYPYLG
jgi:hypothetical protein